jgi:uncharacterized protein (DUF2236 family)
MSAAILPPARDWQSLSVHPGTITWRRAGDPRLLLAAGYALLLQVSHPTVGAGVSQHSEFRRDPWGRLLRTLDYAYTIVYGGPSAAGEMGRRMRSLHARIQGTGPDGRPYDALEPQAYAWVHATLAQAIVLAHERFARPMSASQRERFWAEWRSLGRLLGIRERDLPTDWSAFDEYFADMVDGVLEHTAAVDEVMQALAQPSPPGVMWLAGPLWMLARMPLAHVLELVTLGLLPAQLRERFALGWSRTQELQLDALALALRASAPLPPAFMRNTGPAYLRWRAASIAARIEP